MTGSTRVRDLTAWQALDSRGKPTVACAVELENGTRHEVIAPSGASTGRAEAQELRDGGARWAGQGVSGAVHGIQRRLRPALAGVDVLDQAGVDAILDEVDGTETFGVIGGNAAVAVSLAAWLAGARALGVEPWQRAADLWDCRPTLPLPMVNILSGGAHAGVRPEQQLSVQDVLAVPLSPGTLPDAIEMIWHVRRATEEIAVGRGVASALVADEGGLAPLDLTTAEALELVTAGISRAGLTPGVDVGLAIDVAANQLAQHGGYRIDGRLLHAGAMKQLAAEWVRDYAVVSIEDLLDDRDWEGWDGVSATLNDVQVLADDLIATQSSRIGRAHTLGVNAVLLKANQAGSLSRAAQVLRFARDAHMSTVVSARSGDTEDSWLADLAVGWGAGQIKVGSLTRSERTAKWNRLLALAARHGSDLPYAGAGALAGRVPAEPMRSNP